MNDINTESIARSPEFQALLKVRFRLALPIATTIIVVYFGFILLVAFQPSILATRLGESSISIGIYAGLALLGLSFILTSLYIWLSNKTIDPLQNEIQDKYQ